MITGDIHIKDLTKTFHTIGRKVVALRDVSIDIQHGEFFVCLGPSGCGKSTLLNIIAGLEKPSQGEILFGDQIVVSAHQKIFLSPKMRNVAMVFQSYALYPHLNIYKNIAFPLTIAKVPKHTIRPLVTRVAQMLNIEDLLSAKPKELSGGQRQRVAMARALVREPSVFLLDEPLSNLDAQLRLRMREELKNLQRRLGITTIYVTHDQVEAMTLGDRIVVLKDGITQQIGRPLEIYQKPVNTFVAGFLGTPPMNLLAATLDEEKGAYSAVIDGFKIKIGKKLSTVVRTLKSRDIIIGIRPEDVKIAKREEQGTIKQTVTFVEHLGTDTIVYFSMGGAKLLARMKEETNLKQGDVAHIYIPPEKLHIFDKNGRNIEKY